MRRIPAFRRTLAVLAFCWLATLATAQGYGFPVTVENPTNVDMVDVPVATGMPIPHYMPVFDPAQSFRLVDDSGTPTPIPDALRTALAD